MQNLVWNMLCRYVMSTELTIFDYFLEEISLVLKFKQHIFYISCIDYPDQSRENGEPWGDIEGQ